MRRFIAFALALAMGLSFVDNAEAKKPKPEPAAAEETTEGGEEASAALEMKMVGVPGVDNVFSQANDPLKNISDAKAKLASLNTNLATALALPEGTPFADALADLKAKGEGKLAMAIDEKGMPKLSASDAVPENVQTALDAVNQGVSDVQSAIELLAAVPDQCKEVASAATGISPSSFTGAGVSPTQVPKMMKTVQGNIKTLGMVPDEVKSVVDAAASVMTTLKDSFAG